jgi:hypothetical protein
VQLQSVPIARAFRHADTAKDAQEVSPERLAVRRTRYFSIMRDSFFRKINFTELRFCLTLIITLPGRVTAPRAVGALEAG